MTTDRKIGHLLMLGLLPPVKLGAVKTGWQQRAAGSAESPESSNRGDVGRVPGHYVAEQNGSAP